MKKPIQDSDSRHADKYIVRFPDGMCEQITEAAKENHRSMNAEIVARLAESFSNDDRRNRPERRRLELVASYAEWCARRTPSQGKSCEEYAQEYAEMIANWDPSKEPMHGITRVATYDKVDPEELHALHTTWISERPSTFPFLTDSIQTMSRHSRVELTAKNLKSGELISELMNRYEPGHIEIRIGKLDDESK